MGEFTQIETKEEEVDRGERTVGTNAYHSYAAYVAVLVI